jgi:hypothetical protein
VKKNVACWKCNRGDDMSIWSEFEFGWQHHIEILIVWENSFWRESFEVSFTSVMFKDPVRNAQ